MAGLYTLLTRRSREENDSDYDKYTGYIIYLNDSDTVPTVGNSYTTDAGDEITIDAIVSFTPTTCSCTGYTDSVIEIYVERSVTTYPAVDTGSFYKTFTNCTALKHIYNIENLFEQLGLMIKQNTNSSSAIFYGCTALEELDLSKTTWSKVFTSKNRDTQLPWYVSGRSSSLISCKLIKLPKYDEEPEFDNDGNEIYHVYNLSNMFCYLESLEYVDMTPFNGMNIYSTYNMFYGCKSLKNIILPNVTIRPRTPNTKPASNPGVFTTSNPYGDDALTYYGSADSSSSVPCIDYMFYDCYNLEKIDMFPIQSVVPLRMQNVFQNCYKLKTADLSHLTAFSRYIVSMFRMGDDYDSELLYVKLPKFKTTDINGLDIPINIGYLFRNCQKLYAVDISGIDFYRHGIVSKQYTLSANQINTTTHIVSITLDRPVKNIINVTCGEHNISSIELKSTNDADNRYNNKLSYYDENAAVDDLVTVETSETQHYINGTYLFYNCKNLHYIYYNDSYLIDLRNGTVQSSSNAGYVFTECSNLPYWTTSQRYYAYVGEPHGYFTDVKEIKNFDYNALTQNILISDTVTLTSENISGTTVTIPVDNDVQTIMSVTCDGHTIINVELSKDSSGNNIVTYTDTTASVGNVINYVGSVLTQVTNVIQKQSDTYVPEATFIHNYKMSFIYNKLIYLFLKPYSHFAALRDQYLLLQLPEYCYGQYVDNYGKRFNLTRKPNETDNELKNRINFVSTVAREQGTKETSIKALAAYFGVNPSLIDIRAETPCEVVVTLPSFLYQKIIKGEVDVNEILQYFPLGLSVSYRVGNLWNSGEWEDDIDEVYTTWSGQ